MNRWTKLVRKFSWVLLLGLRPTAILGRFVGPKVLINSIPKSGTNLIEEVLHYCPLTRGKIQRTLLPTMAMDKIIHKLSSLKKGQCIPAHLYYSEEVMDVITSNGIKVIFVIRDIRDSLLSHITYLEKIDTTHPHAKIFEKYNSLDEKLEIYLNGSEEFLRWSDFVNNYRGWYTAKQNVLVVRFEELINPEDNWISRTNTLKSIAAFLGFDNIDIDYIADKMINEKGLTYNAPSVNKWINIFTKEQKDKVSTNLADELFFLGYSINGSLEKKLN